LHFLQGPQVFGQNAQSRTSMNNFHDWSIIAEHTWTIGSNKFNEFRFQYARRSVSVATTGSEVEGPLFARRCSGPMRRAPFLLPLL